MDDFSYFCQQLDRPHTQKKDTRFSDRFSAKNTLLVDGPIGNAAPTDIVSKKRTDDACCVRISKTDGKPRRCSLQTWKLQRREYTSFRYVCRTRQATTLPFISFLTSDPGHCSLVGNFKHRGSTNQSRCLQSRYPFPHKRIMSWCIYTDVQKFKPLQQLVESLEKGNELPKNPAFRRRRGIFNNNSDTFHHQQFSSTSAAGSHWCCFIHKIASRRWCRSFLLSPPSTQPMRRSSSEAEMNCVTYFIGSVAHICQLENRSIMQRRRSANDHRTNHRI